MKETAIDITYLDAALAEIAKMPPEELHEDNQLAADLLESAVRDRVRGMSPEEALKVIERSAAAIRARGEATGSQVDAYAHGFLYGITMYANPADLVGPAPTEQKRLTGEARDGK